jgi:predicted DNA-binding transcriptional regulator YafY
VSKVVTLEKNIKVNGHVTRSGICPWQIEVAGEVERFVVLCIFKWGRGLFMRGDRLARQWHILQLLSKSLEGLRVKEIAAQIGEPVRNIYRDLDVLQKAGFPLYTEKDGPRSRWLLVDGFHLEAKVSFLQEELIALELAYCLMKAVGVKQYTKALSRFLEKVRLTLPASLRRRLETMHQSLSRNLSLYNMDEENRKTLLKLGNLLSAVERKDK